MWISIWIAWLLFLVIADVLANRKPGATFSEHSRIWFKSTFARILLALFFIALYLHFVINLPVWPVIGTGAGLGFFVAKDVYMRWDKLLQGALFSGFLTAVLGAAPFFTDGKITGAESVMLLGTFLGGVGFYIKEHSPVEPTNVQ
jgi:hypothetical protein